MATTIRHLTYADLDSIPQERPGDRHELIDGELFVTPSPVPVHQIISANLFRRLDRHVADGELGMVLFAPIDLRLTPDNVLVPDIIFVSRERLHIIGPRAVDAPPELVVEILSPGTRRDLTTKCDLYARFEIPEYWIVDPQAKTVTVLSLREGRYEPVPVGEDGVIDSRILPGMALTLDQAFEGVR